MKIISRLITLLLGIVFIFTIINLVYGCFKYDWITNYMEILNEKDWNTTISEVNILDPISILSLFNDDVVSLSGDVEEIEEVDIIPEVEEVSTWDNEIDPYDPEFEDEFNSFFWDEEGIEEELTEDPSETLVVDNEPSVGEQLVEKFNE